MKRVEVVVPTDDAEAIRALAVLLRSGGKDADRIRARLRLLAPSAKRGTGADIVAMFQDSPFAELGIEIPHDMSVAKPIDI